MTEYQVQAEKAEKYSDRGYLTPRRWSSYALQIREVMLLKPEKILEIGPGNHLVSSILNKLGFQIKTLDLDTRLKPTYIGSITDEVLIKKLSGKFDLVLACQVFEHLKYEDFLQALRMLKRVAPKVVMSLPYTEVNSKFFQLSLKVPKLKKIAFTSKLIFKPMKHEFNGEHYWEIGKKNYSLFMVKRDIKKCGWRIEKSFLNPDNPFHQFFILSCKL